MVMKRLRRKEKQKGKGEKRGDSPSASPKSCRLQHAKATLTVGISVHGSKSTCSCYRDKLLGTQRGYWTHMGDSPLEPDPQNSDSQLDVYPLHSQVQLYRARGGRQQSAGT